VHPINPNGQLAWAFYSLWSSNLIANLFFPLLCQLRAGNLRVYRWWLESAPMENDFPLIGNGLSWLINHSNALLCVLR